MNCCICGDSLDFASKLIGGIVVTNYGVAKFMCKSCKKIKDEAKKE